jgi:hypothetical protein
MATQKKSKKAAKSKKTTRVRTAAKKGTKATATTKTKKATKARAAKSAKRATKSSRPATRRRRIERAPEPQVTDNPLGGESILTPEVQQPLLSTNSGASWDYNPDPRVLETLEETEQQDGGSEGLVEDLREYSSTSPKLSAGDLDANWERAESVGEEAVGGSVATPDQDVVDELGQAVGLEYQDEEPIDIDDKLARRDRDRWELNPASDQE